MNNQGELQTDLAGTCFYMLLPLQHISAYFSSWLVPVGGILGSPCTCPEQAVDPCAQDLRLLGMAWSAEKSMSKPDETWELPWFILVQ